MLHCVYCAAKCSHNDDLQQEVTDIIYFTLVTYCVIFMMYFFSILCYFIIICILFIPLIVFC